MQSTASMPRERGGGKRAFAQEEASGSRPAKTSAMDELWEPTP